MLNTIAELPAYRTFAQEHLSGEERQAIIDYLAEHPKAEAQEGCENYAGAKEGEAKAAE